MPLRDHFEPPISKRISWEGFHAMWPGSIVDQLNLILPESYAAEPRVTTPWKLENQDDIEYATLVYDLKKNRELVAAIELVSPGNKDRPEFRSMFVSKCARLLSQGVCVTIVDLVSPMRFNLYSELLAMIDQRDPSYGDEPSSMYATTLRTRKSGPKPKTEAWSHTLSIGTPLPTLPVWLSETLSVSLQLEPTYEAACRSLRIA
jgi:Protein of unknown function (DUF4058)